MSRRNATTKLTAGEVARLCEVAPRTVAVWCDGGKLPCHRLPGSQARRILRSDLADFLKANGVPLPPGIFRPTPAVLLIGLDHTTAEAVRAAMPGVEVHAAAGAFAAGMLAERGVPGAVAIDAAMGRIEAGAIAEALEGTPVVGYGDAGLVATVAKGKGPAALAEHLIGIIGRHRP